MDIGPKTQKQLKVPPDGRIIYHAAALGIIYDPTTHSQVFFNKHTDDITAFALCEAATDSPSVFVWDTHSMSTHRALRKRY